MALPVYTHPLHGSADLRSEDVLTRGSLLAVHGRVLAVARGTSVDLYDCNEVCDTSTILGAGTCKIHFICSFAVTDISDPVSLASLLFLHGGLLALSGTCSRGIVVHAYKLSFTSTTLAIHPFKTELAAAAAPSLDTQALPQLVFRAALPLGSAVSILPHPTLPHTVAVVLAGDSSVRFYDCSPVSDAVVPALADCSAGVVTHSGAPCARVHLSRDGSVLVMATVDREIAVYQLMTARLEVPGGTRRHIVSGQLHVSFVAESDVTALTLMQVPVPSDAALYHRFQLNGYAVVSGHMNGGLNVWWCGNVEGTGPVVHHKPLAAYPAFHASRGPITHLSPSFTIDEGVKGEGDGALGVPPVFQTMLSQRQRTTEPGTSRREGGNDASSSAEGSDEACSCICVGAHGARGWRVLTFPHTPLRTAVSAHIAARIPTHALIEGGAGDPMDRPDTTLGRWSYDANGRRTWVPPPAASVVHLVTPYIACPSFGQCISAPIIGDAGGATSSEPVLRALGTAVGQYPGVVLPTAPMAGAGIEPRGAVLLQRYPSADGLSLARSAGRDVATGSPTDDGADARALFPGLPPSGMALDRSLFRLLARDYAGNFELSKPGDASNKHTNSASAPHPAHRWIPRTVLLLMTERGVHAAGFDYHTGLTGNGRPDLMAARAMGYTVPSSGMTPSADPFFGGYAPYALPGAHPPAMQIPSARVQAAVEAASVLPPRLPAAPVAAPPPHAPKRVRRPRVAYDAQPQVSVHRLKTAWPMAITGRQDSVIRGERAVFHHELADEQTLALLPREAHDLLNETAFTAGHARAERMAEAAVDAARVQRRNAQMTYLPRHMAARLAAKAAEKESPRGQAAPNVPVARFRPGVIRKAPAPATVPIINRRSTLKGPTLPAALPQAAETSSVDMDLGSDEEAEDRYGSAGASGTAAARTGDPGSLLSELGSMKAELMKVREQFRNDARMLSVQAVEAAIEIGKAAAAMSPRTRPGW